MMLALPPAVQTKLRSTYQSALDAQAKYEFALDIALAALGIPNARSTEVDLDTGTVTVPDPTPPKEG